MATNFDQIIQSGLKAHKLAVAERTAIEARLAAGTIEGLAADLVTLGATVPGQIAARRAAKESTVSQAVALANVASILTAIRQAVKSHGAPADVRVAYGVGSKLDKATPKSVFAAATGVLRAVTSDLNAARSFGVLDGDLAALTSAVAAAQTADTEQDDRRASAPAATKTRNAAAKNVEGAVKRISSAGALHYATDAKLRAQFEALVASEGRPKKSAPKPV